MLVTEDGQITGSISGGCLEGDALRKSILAIQQETPRLVTYDTGDEQDASFGAQLGCAGIIQVLFEPIRAGLGPLELLNALTQNRRKNILVTFYDPENPRGDQPGTCMVWSESGLELDRSPDPEWCHRMEPDVRRAFREGRSLFMHYAGTRGSVHAFIEYLPPPVRLVIAGAGNDAIPVTRLAEVLGWEVVIVDGRPDHIHGGNFTAGCSLICAPSETALEQLTIDTHTVFLLMSHNYVYDMGILSRCLHSPTPYVGVLGPRKKMDRMTEELKASANGNSELDLGRIHGPAGLDLGAETPEEIALSMVSGILSALRGTPGTHLSLQDGVIHKRQSMEVESRQW